MKNRALLFFQNRLDFILCVIAVGVLVVWLATIRSAHPFQLILLTSLWSTTGVYDIFNRSWFAKGSHSVRAFKVFAVGFVLTFVVRQMFVRDALVSPAAYVSSTGELIGGPLGEPNVEGIAIACIGGICLLQLDAAIDAGRFSFRDIIRVGLRTLLLNVAVWVGISCAYILLLRFDVVRYESIILSKALFEFSFSNQERILFIAPIAALYVCAMLFAIRRYAPPSRV